MSEEISDELLNKLCSRKKTKCGFDIDSFERFGFDLCELILSYLSFRDKVIFECVSKLWQILLFKRQNGLRVIQCPALAYMRSNSFVLREWMSWNSVFYKSDSLFANLLNKLSFLKKLSLIHRIDGGILRTITNNCHYLEILISEGRVNRQPHYTVFARENNKIFRRKFKNYTEIDLREFGIKFSQSMKFVSIKNFDNKEMRVVLRRSPNLERIDCNSFSIFMVRMKFIIQN
jgi:hypothetical protein